MLEKDADTFIRFNEAVNIRKIKKFNENSFETIVSERRPFNLDTNMKLSMKKIIYTNAMHILKRDM